MRFEYEINADQFVASQLLHRKLKDGRKRFEPVGWLLAGISLVAIAWSEWSRCRAATLLALIGVWWIYSAVTSLFPARYFRRAYSESDLAGKRYKADVGEEGFEVIGDQCSWRIRWSGVREKGENDRIFLLYSQGVLFVFGKEYLSNEQQEDLRRLSGLG